MARRTQGEGSVYLRKDGRYAAASAFEGKRITKYGKTKKEAWENLQAALNDLKSGKVVLGPKLTVGEYLTAWLENIHRFKIELTTLDQYRCVLHAHLIPAFGHLQLSRLTREQVQAFYAEKFDEGLSPGRIHFIHVLLSAALKDAVRNDVLAQNVCTRVTTPRVKKVKHQVLGKEQCNRLFDAARGRRLWFLVLLAITTGARVGELLALQWDDLDINSLRIHIHRSVGVVVGMGIVEKQPKTASGIRRVVLTQAVIEAIPEQKKYIETIRSKADQWEDMNLIFPNKCGRYMRSQTVLKELRAILLKVGMPTMRFHELRHSAATLLFAAGINAKVVQETLGHSNVATTLGLYGEVMPDMQQEVADVMDRLFE